MMISPEKTVFFGISFPASTPINMVIRCWQRVSSLLSMLVSSGSQQVASMELLYHKTKKSSGIL